VKNISKFLKTIIIFESNIIKKYILNFKTTRWNDQRIMRETKRNLDFYILRGMKGKWGMVNADFRATSYDVVPIIERSGFIGVLKHIV